MVAFQEIMTARKKGLPKPIKEHEALKKRIQDLINARKHQLQASKESPRVKEQQPLVNEEAKIDKQDSERKGCRRERSGTQM